MTKSTQETEQAHRPWQRLKQAVRRLPILGEFAYWLSGIVGMNALRRQNAVEHAHFLALHLVLEKQLEQMQAQQANLTSQLEQQIHRQVQTQQQLEHHVHVQRQLTEQQQQFSQQQQQHAQDFAQLQQKTEQDQTLLREQIALAAAQNQLQRQEHQHALQHQLEALRAQHTQAMQQLQLQVNECDEQRLQADIATDILAQRVAGLTKLQRQRNSENKPD